MLKFPFVLEHPEDISDLQFIMVRGVGFALLVLLVIKWLWPSMIQPHLTDRRRAISEEAEQVERTLNETQEMRADYRERLTGIESETQRRIDEAIHEADTLRDTILREAQETAAAIRLRGEAEVSRERAKALVQLRAQFVNNIVGAAQHAARESTGEPQHRRLIAEFTQQLGAES